MICCIANCNFAYGQEVQINERLPDGTLIITVDGKKYRALTVEQIRQVQIWKVGFESLTEENTLLRMQNKSLRESVELSAKDKADAAAELNLANERGDNFKKLYEDERALRLKSEQLPPKKNTLEKILDHPVTKIIVVAVVGVTAARQ